MRGAGRAALVAGALAGALAGCRSGEVAPTPMEQAGSARSEGMRGITMHNFRAGDTRWVLRADSASVFRERKRVEAEAVRVDFYEEEEHVSTLTAERGVLLQATDDLEVRGSVRVRSDDGTVLLTDVLYWDHQRSLIHTDRFVRIEKGEDVLTGVGLEADPGLDRIELQREVRGSVRDPEGALGGSKEEGR